MPQRAVNAAIVLDGNENQAVACVRSLSSYGHRVIVGEAATWSKAGWSRHAADTFAYTDPTIDVDRFVVDVCNAVRRHAPALLLPLTERSLIPLSERRELLYSAGASLVLPSHDRVLNASNKAHLLSVAAGLGVRTPRTLECHPGTRADEIHEACGLPLVLKPSSSFEFNNGTAHPTGPPVYALSVEELRDRLREMHHRCSRFVAQEFVTGQGLGYFAVCIDGVPIADFAHRRLRDVRPSGSGSSLRESIAMPPSIRHAGRRVLQALSWHGVAMLEFKGDPNADPALIEMNVRFWGSLALALKAGRDFPALMADIAAGRPPVAPPPYAVGVRSRWLAGDLQHLAAVMSGPPKGFPLAYPSRLGTMWSVLVDGWRESSDNFWWSDPLPEVGDLLHFAFRRIPRLLSGGRR
jgi:predicted ATP-grasp superfamily ATP-dependent carboligase